MCTLVGYRGTDGVARIGQKGHYPAPVSYTHLDVYKRQIKDFAKIYKNKSFQ